MAPNLAVSLVKDMCATNSPLLFVRQRESSWEPKYNFTLCSVPLHSNFADKVSLIQYIEVNGVFGADHFIFYNYSSSPVLAPIFSYYAETGKVDVIQWTVPVYTSRKIGSLLWFFGQVVALNDCVLRAMLTSRYVVSLDMDEVILPLQTHSWLSLMEQQRENHPAAFTFANTFFRKQYKKNPRFLKNDMVKRYPLAPLLYTTRDRKVFAYKSRSKFIAQAEHVILANIHFPFKMESGHTSVNVSTGAAILAHYRRGLGKSEGEVIETRVHDFSERILQRVSVVDAHIQKST